MITVFNGEKMIFMRLDLPTPDLLAPTDTTMEACTLFVYDADDMRPSHFFSQGYITLFHHHNRTSHQDPDQEAHNDAHNPCNSQVVAVTVIVFVAVSAVVVHPRFFQ